MSKKSKKVVEEFKDEVIEKVGATELISVKNMTSQKQVCGSVSFMAGELKEGLTYEELGDSLPYLVGRNILRKI